MILNHQTQNSFKIQPDSTSWPSNSTTFEDSKIDLDTVDDTTVSDTLPWSQFEPQICLSLTKYRKDTTKPEVYKQVFLEIASRHQNYV